MSTLLWLGVRYLTKLIIKRLAFRPELPTVQVISKSCLQRRAFRLGLHHLRPMTHLHCFPASLRFVIRLQTFNYNQRIRYKLVGIDLDASMRVSRSYLSNFDCN